MARLRLYTDHSIIARETNWPAIEAAAKSTVVRPVMSLWNLVEIALASDKSQRRTRASFIDSLKPLWVFERLVIQKLEVEAFVRREFWHLPASAVDPFTEHFSVVLSHFDRDGRGLGATARQWIEETDLSNLEGLKKLTPASLLTLQAADRKKLKSIEPQAFRQWMWDTVPDLDPDKRAHIKAQKDAMADFCLKNQKALLQQCPAVAVEDKLYDIRIQDPSRKPTDSDAVDLQHSVVALSYCDVFLVGDGYVRECAARLGKISPVRLARVIKSASEIPS
jgi:hypothetical protein